MNSVRLWHFSAVPTAPSNVGFREKTRRHMLNASSSQFDPKRQLAIKDQLVYISAMSQTPVQLPRGRPRSFDTEAAVERAMGVFWSRGYHSTALPDLLRATKLSRGSLYAAFGDKHSLFLRALDRYVANALTRMDIELDPRREPVDGLRAYLAGYVDRTSGANGRRGCLLVATAMELSAEELERLNGQVVQVIRKIGQPPEALMRDLGEALANCVARHVEVTASGTEG